MTITISENQASNIPLQRLSGLSSDENPGCEFDWVVDAKKALTDLLRIKANWDGQEAYPPDIQVVKAASRLVEELARNDCPRPIGIYPTRTAGVQIEWENGQKYLEVELSPEPLQAEFFFSDGEEGKERSGTIRVNDSLKEVLELALRVHVT